MNRKRDKFIAKTFKIINVGHTNVGKSSILLKYTKEEFKEAISNTIGIDYVNKSVYIEGVPIVLQLWDTAGQERFDCIVRSYYRGADAFMFVYDVTDQRTFEYIKSRIERITQENKEVKFGVLVANKIDLLNESEFEEKEQVVKELAEKYKFDYYLTSAKTGESITTMYEDLASKINEQKKVEEEQKEILNNIELTKKHTKRSCC
ncbi:hypothetical protein NUSPORA_01518 [Nucleospora cyclopteri]